MKETLDLTEESVRAAYDEVPYPSGFYRQTHPDNLATRAFLQGMDPAPPYGVAVGPSGMGVADFGGEELGEPPPGPFAGLLDDDRE